MVSTNQRGLFFNVTKQQQEIKGNAREATQST